MMKVSLFLVVYLFLNSVLGMAQKCKVQGVVRYKYNDYIRYKEDIGAEISFIAKADADSLNISHWDEYGRLAQKQSAHKILAKSVESSYAANEDVIRSVSKFSVNDEARLKKLDEICLAEYLRGVTLSSYVGLVDNSGKYEVEIPYGEYYVIAKSANRKRSTLTEITGRILFKEIQIDKPMKILSFDFDY